MKWIEEKHEKAHPSMIPQWLLILVNKVDLFAEGIDEAESYYVPGHGRSSPFLNRYKQHREIMGADTPMYVVLPVSTGPGDFKFATNYGILESQSQLRPEQCEMSIKLLIASLGEVLADEF